MKKIYFVIFTLLTYAGHAQEKKAADAANPPAIFVLTVDGKDYPITEGEQVKLEGT